MLKKIAIGFVFFILLVLTIFSATAKDDSLKTEKDIKLKSYFVDVDFYDKIKSDKSEIELKSKIKIEKDKVTITEPDLKDKKAKLTFKYFCAKNPIILHDGKWDRNVVPKQTKLCEYEVDVNHFSTWEIVDNTFNGTHNRTTVYTEGLGLDIDALLLMSFDDVDKDSTNVEDYSYYSNNASIPLKWVTGKVGNGLFFNGDDTYIDTPQDYNPTDFSIMFWIKTEYSEVHGMIIGTDSASEYIRLNNGLPQLIYRNSTSSQITCRSGTTVNNGVWQHLAITYNSTSKNLTWYINATENIGLCPQPSENNQDIQTTEWGNYIGRGGNQYGNQTLDEVKIYQKALTQDEITNIYNNESTGLKYHDEAPTDGLKNYYNFDESAGNIIDQVGSIDGTPIGLDYQDEGMKSYSGTFDSVGDLVDFNDPIVDGWSAVTFSIWARTDSMPSDGSPTTHKLVGNNGGNSHFITFNELNDITSIYFRNVSLDAVSCATGANGGIVENGGWQHHVATIDLNGDGKVRYYRDGSLVCTSSMAINGTFLDGGDLFISASAGRQFNGSVDEFRIYNKSLNQNEINALYYSGAEILNLDLDESNYDLAKDSSGASNNGTLISWIRPENTTGNWSQGLEFDGVDDVIPITDVHLSANTSQTINMWIKFNNISKKQCVFDLGYDWVTQRGILFINWDEKDTSTYNSVLATGNTFTPARNEWFMYTAVYNGTGLTIYINGTITGSRYYVPYGFAQNGFFGAENGNANYFNGSIDEFKVLNRSLNADEVLELYNSNPYSKYYGTGSYETEIYNVSDYTTGVETNLWTALVTDNITDIVEVWGRGGNCTTLSGDSYTIGTWNGTYYTFSGEQGECFQANLILEGDTENITYYDNVIITAVRVILPFTDNETIYTPYNIFTNTSISGQAMFLVNDTDTGSLEFNWYVNNVNVYNQTFTALANGSTADSLISSSYYVKEDEVNFTVTPITQTIWGNATGQTIWSLNTITINNSNFTMSREYPTLTNFSWQVDNEIEFEIGISDIDSDVNCTWNATTPLNPTITSGSGLSFTPLLTDYNPTDIVTVHALCTDGEYTQEVIWSMTITESLGLVSLDSFLPIMLLICVLIGLFALGTWYFETELKYVCFLGCALCVVTGLYLAAKMSESSFPAVTSVMWTLFWVGAVGFFCLVLYVLWRFTEAYKFEKTQKPGLK